MKRALVLWALVGSGCAGAHNHAPVSRPDPAGVENTVLLIGDAGAPSPDDPVLLALAREIARDAAATTVVFLGDNIYPVGMPDVRAFTRADAERRLDAQLVASTAARQVFFIPGNHDWAWRQPDGWLAIERQRRYLEENSKARLHPENGCPGPDVVDLGPRLRLILIDTQWWLEEGQRLGLGVYCSTADPDSFVIALDDAIAGAEGRPMIVAGHHPLASSGPHGGRFGWQDHIFPLRALADWAWIPLPVIGSIYPIARISGISGQDISSRENQALRASILEAFAREPPLVYVAGHEHGLEVHRGPGARFTLVSGAGSSGKISRLYPREGTLFATPTPGFMRVDVYRDGRVYLTAINVDETGAAFAAFGQWLR